MIKTPAILDVCKLVNTAIVDNLDNDDSDEPLQAPPGNLECHAMKSQMLLVSTR